MTRSPTTITAECTAIAAVLRIRADGLIKAGIRRQEAEYLEPYLRSALSRLQRYAEHEAVMEAAIKQAGED